MRGGLLGLIAGLALAAPAASADYPIAFADFSYSPASVTATAGDTATFSGDFTRHPLVWDGGQFTSTTTGTSRTFTFTAPGTYSYYCAVHRDTRGMKGVITVEGNQRPGRVSFSASPATATVGQAVTFTYTGDPDPDGTLVRWEWDLEGDGSFETTTGSGTATHTYASPGTVTVRMRAIDNADEASAVAAQALTVVAAGSGASVLDRTAPLATRLKLKGLTLTFRASERATATATLRRSGRTLAKGSAKAGRTTIHLKLTKAGRSVLRRGHRVKAALSLTLRDASGNARTVKRRVTVKRSYYVPNNRANAHLPVPAGTARPCDAWIPALSAALALFHGCGSEAASDRAPAHDWISSGAGAPPTSVGRLLSGESRRVALPARAR